MTSPFEKRCGAGGTIGRRKFLRDVSAAAGAIAANGRDVDPLVLENLELVGEEPGQSLVFSGGEDRPHMTAVRLEVLFDAEGLDDVTIPLGLDAEQHLHATSRDLTSGRIAASGVPTALSGVPCGTPS